MKKFTVNALLLAAMLISAPASAAVSNSGVVMTAYQRAYAMNFEIWKPGGLPAGWYATFDGYPVAQIAENRWVYGQIDSTGTIRPTNVLVGSVVPENVRGLVRVVSVWNYGRAINSPEFLKIREYRCNRMGWLNEETYSTLIAWNTNRPGVYIWLGNRWKRFEPRSDEYTWQMLKRLGPWIAAELKKNNAWIVGGGEPLEAADLARQWGLIWGGRVVLEELKMYKSSGGGSGSSTSFHETSSSSSSGSTPKESTGGGSKQWDVD